METDRTAAGPGRPWTWDPTLYAGSAAFYAKGRVAYPAGLAHALVHALDLDGSGVLLDVGCGPGSLTLLLAPYFAAAVGVDADADMLAEGASSAVVQQVHNVSWRHLRAEDLPADLPRPRLVSFAQSFHWLDRPRVAAVVRRMLVDGGAVVHVGATTHQGVDGTDVLPHPRPPREEITRLVRRHLGPHRRAGHGVLTGGTAGDEDAVFRQAGFDGPHHLEVPGRVVERTEDEIAASIYSLSSSAPHLFGDRLDAFDDERRRLLAVGSDGGRYSEQLRSITVSIWR